MLRVFFTSVAVAAIAVACGGQSEPTVPPPDTGSSVTGTVGGSTLFVADAVSTQTTLANESDFSLVMSSTANVCSVIASPTAIDSITYFFATISTMPPEPSVRPGVYAITNADGGSASTKVNAYYWRSTGPCMQSEDVATGGTITIDVLTTLGATGTFSIDFADGHFDGTFDAPTCASSGTMTSPACK